MLDQYIWTDVSRISPEAPVPVCHVQHSTYRLGGAGNVAHNLRAFGADVTIAGMIGQDDAARQISSMFDEYGIHHALTPWGYPTICKSRVMA